MPAVTEGLSGIARTRALTARAQEQYLDSLFRNKHLGQACVIVGGGPSVSLLNGSQLEATSTILINHANFLPETVNFRDRAVAGVILDEPLLIEKFTALVSEVSYPCFTGNTPYDSDALLDYLNRVGVYRIPSNHTEGLGDTFSRFVNGGNSGYAAIQLAVIMGFSRIGLVGFDGDVPGHETHFHGSYGRVRSAAPLNQWCELLESMRPLLLVTGVELYNLSRQSQLQRYPKIDVGEWNVVARAASISTASPAALIGAQPGGVLQLPYPANRYSERSARVATCYGGARNDADPGRYRPIPSACEELLVQSPLGTSELRSVLACGKVSVPPDPSASDLDWERFASAECAEPLAKAWLEEACHSYSSMGACCDLTQPSLSRPQRDRYALVIGSLSFSKPDRLFRFVQWALGRALAIAVVVDVGSGAEEDDRAKDLILLLSPLMAVCEYRYIADRYVAIHAVVAANAYKEPELPQ